jgi:bifunctional dethiobiotin synthetase / adenosylmethionine---8-amino-7-oxononanoate aminotransferase
LEVRIEDDSIIEKVRALIQSSARDGFRYAVVETAGGALSPAPSGILQADLYRPLRLPVSLVGDHRLGGIGSTISAFESLHIRGYEVASVVLFEDQAYGNHEYLHHHFKAHGIQTFALPQPPARQQDPKDDVHVMREYYDNVSQSAAIRELVDLVDQNHYFRISKLSSMPALAESIIWHPFRQHGIPQDLLAIDSAYGDFFQGVSPRSLSTSNESAPHQSLGITSIRQGPELPILEPLFDGSASWWTQGLGHGNPDLALTAAHAAGRYGHVMFASAAHAPALDLSSRLLSMLANPRLSRVFFSDNGSTGIEVALKMALRSSAKRYGWTRDDEPIGVLGFKGSYHGDCIATMNCSEPSTYNEAVNWYQPWGWWFDPPSLRMRSGVWELQIPDVIGLVRAQFQTLEDIFDFNVRSALGHVEAYERFIMATLKRLIIGEGRKFGALICEPILMGAGGMIFVDPLFQRTLIKVVRASPELFATNGAPSQPRPSTVTEPLNWSGLPIIADEVFTGLYRLGRASSSSFLSNSQNIDSVDEDVAPDISVHAKLLTGGLLPLAITTASESIFNTFLSDKKQDALLHGHSYTAHAVGCAVAEKSIATLSTLAKNGAWRAYQTSWQTPSRDERSQSGQEGDFWSFWNQSSVKQLSESTQVEGVFALGSVLAIYMKTEGGQSGYTSDVAADLQRTLLRTSESHGDFGVHSRVLGNVLYLMASMTSKPESLAAIEKTLVQDLV